MFSRIPQSENNQETDEWMNRQDLKWKNGRVLSLVNKTCTWNSWVSAILCHCAWAFSIVGSAVGVFLTVAQVHDIIKHTDSMCAFEHILAMLIFLTCPQCSHERTIAFHLSEPRLRGEPLSCTVQALHCLRVWEKGWWKLVGEGC